MFVTGKHWPEKKPWKHTGCWEKDELRRTKREKRERLIFVYYLLRRLSKEIDAWCFLPFDPFWFSLFERQSDREMKDANRADYPVEQMNEWLIAPNMPTYWWRGREEKKKWSQGNATTYDTREAMIFPKITSTVKKRIRFVGDFFLHYMWNDDVFFELIDFTLENLD